MLFISVIKKLLKVTDVNNYDKIFSMTLKQSAYNICLIEFLISNIKVVKYKKNLLNFIF